MSLSVVHKVPRPTRRQLRREATRPGEDVLRELLESCSSDGPRITPMEPEVCGPAYFWDRIVAAQELRIIGNFGMNLARLEALKEELLPGQYVFKVAAYYRRELGDSPSLDAVLERAVWILAADDARPIRQLHQKQEGRWIGGSWVIPEAIYQPPHTSLQFEFLEPEAVREYLGL